MLLGWCASAFKHTEQSAQGREMASRDPSCETHPESHPPEGLTGLIAWALSHPQFIVAEDGSCGMVYEHAAAEGPPIVALVDHVIEYT